MIIVSHFWTQSRDLFAEYAHLSRSGPEIIIFKRMLDTGQFSNAQHRRKRRKKTEEPLTWLKDL